MNTGDLIQRNYVPLLDTRMGTEFKCKSIHSGAKFYLKNKYFSGCGMVYEIEDLMGTRYQIVEEDALDYFFKVDTESSVLSKTKCVCDSLDLFRYGCRCGTVQNKLDERYIEMQQELLGRKK